ncbi:MAG: MFS transporter, partial [Marmoricola sp.]
MSTETLAQQRQLAPKPGRDKAALVIASFGAFLAFLDATIVNVCFPAIEQTFHGSSTSTLSWVLNAYNVVFAALLVAGGRLADLLGRRRVFITGVAIFTVASVLCATAGSVEVLIGWRVVQAVGAALLVPASLGVVIQAATEDRRAHAVSLWGATAALAAGLGPPIGGMIIAASGWRLAFLVNLPLGIAAIVLGMKMVDESRSPGRRKLPDLAGVAVLAAGLALLSLAIVKGPDWSWGSPRTLACILGGTALIGVVGVRINRHPVPVIDPGLLRIGSFAVANAATLAAGMGMYAYLLNHILWLRYVWHYSLLQAGFAVAPSALVTAVVAARMGEVAHQRGYRYVAFPGAILWAGGMWWFIHQVGTSPDYLHDWLPGAVISGIGCGMTLPILGSAAVAAVPGGRYATASSIVSAVRQLGGVLGISVLIAIVGKASPADPLGAVELFRDGWRLSFGCFVAVAVIVLGVSQRPPQVSEQAPPEALPPVRRRPVLEAPRRGLQSVSAFRGLAPEAADDLAERGTRQELRAGEVLFREGEDGPSVFVLLSGRLRVEKHGEVIRELGNGSLVGELAVLAGAPRGATVIAARDSVLLEIAGEDVRSVLASQPAAALSVAGVLAEQVRTLPAPAEQKAEPCTVAVIAAEGAAPFEVAEVLRDAMAAHLQVELVREELSPERLVDLEADFDRVLLVTGPSGSWHDFCLRQADVVVLVVDPKTRALPSVPGAEVLLLGDVDQDRILAVLAATGARRVHQQRHQGVAALGARLAGRSVGLALAGGGARAFAHVGVLRELEAAGVVVHRVAGTSVGSYIGAFYASGWAVDDIEELLREEFVRRNPLGDYGLPKYALSRGRRIERAAIRLYGDQVAEALPRELTVMTTDLLAREAVPMRSGLLRDITRASAAVPGLLPPVRVGDRILVDGGVTGNLPVGPLAAEGVGPVIAVNLSAGAREDSPGAGPKRPPRIPTLGETMVRTMLFASGDTDRSAADEADLVVSCQTRHIGLLEFHQIDEA